MDLCHLFMLIESDGPEPAALAALGLAESFRRDHPGQGTANLCYCFDNAYLELLWVTDAAALEAPRIRRTRFQERAAWRRNGASPFGVGLRGDGPLPFETWAYRPPYLPDGMSLPVAVDSDHPGHPFLFRSPGAAPPIAWSDDRAGRRQTASGLREIIGLSLETPVAAGIPASLRALEALGLLRVAHGAAHRLTVEITGDQGPRRLSLPDCVWL